MVAVFSVENACFQDSLATERSKVEYDDKEACETGWCWVLWKWRRTSCCLRTSTSFRGNELRSMYVEGVVCSKEKSNEVTF